VSTARGTVAVGPTGTVPGLVASSLEQGPQVVLSIEEGSLQLAGKAGTVTGTATPKAAGPTDAPAQGVLVSNVYDFTVSTDTGAAAALGTTPRVLATLRSSVQTRNAVVLVQRGTGGWQQVPTFQTGLDVYAAELTRLDPVALVALPSGVEPTVKVQQGGNTGDGGTGAVGASGVPGWVYGAAGGMAVLVIGVLLLLRRRMAG
jgi:hypothetical protein